jgi:hypothetical protein
MEMRAKTLWLILACLLVTGCDMGYDPDNDEDTADDSDDDVTPPVAVFGGRNFIMPRTNHSVGTKSVATNIPSRTSPAVPSRVATYKDATSCVSLGPRRDAGSAGYYVNNHCSGTITVWLRDNTGTDYRIVRGNSGSNWSTTVQRLSYACFVQPNEDLCER